LAQHQKIIADAAQAAAEKRGRFIEKLTKGEGEEEEEE